MKIRKANKKDFNKLVELGLELLKYEMKLGLHYKIDKETIDYVKKDTKELLRKKDFAIFVAEKDNKIIGFISGMIKILLPIYKRRREGFMLDAFVEKQYRGKDVGSSLLKELEKWFKFKKINFVTTEVYRYNKKALKRWRQLGFRDHYMIRLIKKI